MSSTASASNRDKLRVVSSALLLLLDGDGGDDMMIMRLIESVKLELDLEETKKVKHVAPVARARCRTRTPSSKMQNDNVVLILMTVCTCRPRRLYYFRPKIGPGSRRVLFQPIPAQNIFV